MSSRVKGVLSCLALALLTTAPAHAQIGGRPYEFSGAAGLFHFDARARMHDGLAMNLNAGWRLQPWLTFEGTALFAPSKADSLTGQYGYTGAGSALDGPKHNFMVAGLNLRWNLRPAEGRVVPFLLTGIGYGRSNGGLDGASADEQKLARGAATIGTGVLYNILNERTYLRVEARDVLFRHRDATEFSNHMALLVGLHYVWKGRELDQDRDKVRDWIDKCPDTPIGCTVDAAGCPSDADGDGVCDGVDKCANTMKGCKVDKDGCTGDADGDGICDDLDQCPNTPKGCTVDAKGCPSDPDGDGVCDGVDQCANTPKGCTVDAKGCPSDADGDGVCDGLDLCPNTPKDLKVDEHGCPIEVREREVQLLETGTIRLSNIQFDTGKATLKGGADSLLRQVAQVLVSYPMLRMEISGHTDDRGNHDKNMKLSQARADSVMAWMVRFGLPADMFITKGYGPDRPIAPNTSDLGRSKNRRVDFKVLNTDALRIEREKRRFILKNEGVPQVQPAPADTTHKPAPADTTKKP